MYTMKNSNIKYLFSRFCFQDILNYGRLHGRLPYPIIDDRQRILARKLGMLDADDRDNVGIPVTARAVN